MDSDGVSLCSVSHPRKKGLVNWLKSQYFCRFGRDLSEESLEQAIIEIRRLKEDRGILVSCKPTKIWFRPEDITDGNN